jgi:uncharacterized membrane protein
MSNTLVWIAEGLLAAVFALAGAVKLAVPRERLQAFMHWARSWPRGRIKLLGLAELAGAVGLIVPRATGIAPALTPIAAVCLALLMVGAAQTHKRLGESPLAPVAVGILCVVVAAALVHA